MDFHRDWQQAVIPIAPSLQWLKDFPSDSAVQRGQDCHTAPAGANRESQDLHCTTLVEPSSQQKQQHSWSTGQNTPVSAQVPAGPSGNQPTSPQQLPAQTCPEPAVPNSPVTDSHILISLPCLKKDDEHYIATIMSLSYSTFDEPPR